MLCDLLMQIVPKRKSVTKPKAFALKLQRKKKVSREFVKRLSSVLFFCSPQFLIFQSIFAFSSLFLLILGPKTDRLIEVIG